mgnify:FL=1
MTMMRSYVSFVRLSSCLDNNTKDCWANNKKSRAHVSILRELTIVIFSLAFNYYYLFILRILLLAVINDNSL